MKLKDALKYLGTKVNGKETAGYYVTDIIRNFADDYAAAHPTPQPTEQYTLTYSLGEYGTGSVPEAVTVDDGENVKIDFSKYPSCVSDPSKEFIGWAETDGAETADYEEDGADEITMHNDVTLYPVFASVTQYTLTYALGNDATGSVPSPETVNEGEEVYIDFNTYPSCVSDPSKSFVGWSTTDEASEADYTEDGTNYITMFEDVTLYPVFEEVGGGGDTLEITNSTGGAIEVYDQDLKETVLTVPKSDTDTLTIDAGHSYTITCLDNVLSAEFDGTYGGVTYSDEGLGIDGSRNISNPSNQSVFTWTFQVGDNGTLTITS